LMAYRKSGDANGSKRTQRKRNRAAFRLLGFSPMGEAGISPRGLALRSMRSFAAIHCRF
jgi:hypothetical protein